MTNNSAARDSGSMETISSDGRAIHSRRHSTLAAVVIGARRSRRRAPRPLSLAPRPRLSRRRLRAVSFDSSTRQGSPLTFILLGLDEIPGGVGIVH